MFNEAGGDTAYCSAGGWLAGTRSQGERSYKQNSHNLPMQTFLA